MTQPNPAALPRVAFIIPCFNHGRFVGEAVRSCLGQEGADTRVVVVDDGSDDGSTPAACDRCGEIDPARVLVLHRANAGLPAARNAGARAAAEFAPGFEFVSFLDADDWVEPAFARKLCAALFAADPSHTSHAYCQETLVGLGSGVWRVPEWDPLLLMVTNLHPVTCVVRRWCFDEAGGFDETMRRGYEDWDLWLRFAERGWRGVRVPEPLFTWRRHSAQTMIADAVSRHDELYGALVARHRALFDARAVEVIRLANALLRSGDAHWIDEDRRSILLSQLRAHVRDVYEECFALRERSSRDRAAREAAERALADERANTARVRAGYEAKPAVRLSRRLHGTVDALPRPLAAPIRALLRAARRLAR